ncbi:hypothetical protein JCM10213_001129 [Rhodosporidiobolus nylandii]
MLSFAWTGLPTPSPPPFRLVDGGYLAYSPSARPQLQVLALCTLDNVPILSSTIREPSMEHWDGQPPYNRVEENHLAVSTAPSSSASTVSAEPSLRSSASSTSLASTAASSLFGGDECAFSSRSSTPEPVDAALSTKPRFEQHALHLVTGDYASRVGLSTTLSTVKLLRPILLCPDEKTRGFVVRPRSAYGTLVSPLSASLSVFSLQRVAATNACSLFPALSPFRRVV